MLPDRVHKLEQIVRRHDLRYTVHGQIVSNFMDAEHLPLQKAVVRAMLELCDQVGAGVLVHHCGKAAMTDEAGRDRLDAIEREALAELADVARGYGVKLAFENIFAMDDGEYRQTPAEVADTVRALNHPEPVHADRLQPRLYRDAPAAAWTGAPRSAAWPRPPAICTSMTASAGPTRMTKFYEPSEAVALGIGDLHLPLGWGDIAWEEIFDRAALPARHGDDPGAERRPLRRRAGREPGPRPAPGRAGQPARARGLTDAGDHHQAGRRAAGPRPDPAGRRRFGAGRCA